MLALVEFEFVRTNLDSLNDEAKSIVFEQSAVAKCRLGKRSQQAEHATDVVGRRSGLEAIEEPQPELRVRERPELIAHARAGGQTRQTSTAIGSRPKALRRARMEPGDGTSGLQCCINEQGVGDPIVYLSERPCHPSAPNRTGMCGV